MTSSRLGHHFHDVGLGVGEDRGDHVDGVEGPVVGDLDRVDDLVTGLGTVGTLVLVIARSASSIAVMDASPLLLESSASRWGQRGLSDYVLVLALGRGRGRAPPSS